MSSCERFDGLSMGCVQGNRGLCNHCCVHRRLFVGFMDACYGDCSFGEFRCWCARETFSQFVSLCDGECDDMLTRRYTRSGSGAIRGAAMRSGNGGGGVERN